MNAAAGFPGCLLIFVEAEFPCGAERAEDHVFACRSEAGVGGAVAAPSASDGQEDRGRVFDEGGLVLGREHEVAVALG